MRLTPARSIWKRSASLSIGYGFCAWCARPGGHGRSGVSAAQRCTCESTMCMSGLLCRDRVPSRYGARVETVKARDAIPALLCEPVRVRPRELVQAWVDAFNRADVDALAAFYTED